LETALNNKVAEATNDLTIRVNDISESLGAYVLKEDYDKDIADIRDILTWKEII
jgi:hypothetical protein